MGVGTWIAEKWTNFTDPYGTKAFTKTHLDAFKDHHGVATPTPETIEAARKKTLERTVAMGEKFDKLKMTALDHAIAKEERRMLEGGIVRRSARRLGKIGKWGAIGAAGLAAVGIISSSMRKGREEHASAMPQPDNSELAALEASVAANGPADGRAPNEWQSRIRGAAQQGLAQPTPSVAEGAANMGATRT